MYTRRISLDDYKTLDDDDDGCHHQTHPCVAGITTTSEKWHKEVENRMVHFISLATNFPFLSLLSHCRSRFFLVLQVHLLGTVN